MCPPPLPHLTNMPTTPPQLGGHAHHSSSLGGHAHHPTPRGDTPTACRFHKVRRRRKDKEAQKGKDLDEQDVHKALQARAKVNFSCLCHDQHFSLYVVPVCVVWVYCVCYLSVLCGHIVCATCLCCVGVLCVLPVCVVWACHVCYLSVLCGRIVCATCLC